VTGDPKDDHFHVVAFSGSLGSSSSNTGLVRMAARLAPTRLRFEFVDWLRDLPYYDPDLEADLPAVPTKWRSTIRAADAVVIGMPEYNFGPPGLAKNAIDWLTRPTGNHALSGKVVSMMTSGGKGGGTRVQAGLGPIIGYLGNVVVDEPAINIPFGAERIAVDGTTTDLEIEALVALRMEAVLAALVAQRSSVR